MAYEPEKDITITSEECANGKFKVAIKQYANGPKKISILKTYELQGGAFRETSKIGRLLKEEAEEIATSILKLAKEL